MRVVIGLVIAWLIWTILFANVLGCSTQKLMPQGYEDCRWDRGIMVCPNIFSKDTEVDNEND